MDGSASMTNSSLPMAYRRTRARSGRSPTRATSVIPVVAAPSDRSPTPMAVPTAAVIQRLAAVVRPRMLAPYFKMAPPPRNPMPTTIWDATREMSAETSGRGVLAPTMA